MVTEPTSTYVHSGPTTEKDRDLAYEKSDASIAQYQGRGHGKVLIKETGGNNERLENEEYYDQGFTGQKADDFGKEG